MSKGLGTEQFVPMLFLEATEKHSPSVRPLDWQEALRLHEAAEADLMRGRRFSVTSRNGEAGSPDWRQSNAVQAARKAVTIQGAYVAAGLSDPSDHE
jgi:hypothetical protein